MAEEIQLPGTNETQNSDSTAFDQGSRLQLKPVGTSGTEVYAGYFSEEYLVKLRGRQGAKIWDEMRRSETQVAMLLNAVMNPIKAANWEFEAADIPNGEMHKAFMEFNAFEGIDWETYIHEALTMLIFGFSLFEEVHNVVFNHPKFGTFNGLKAMAFRSQKTIERWNVDRCTGDLKSVEQTVSGDLMPDYKIEMLGAFLHVLSLQKEGDNYEGISALRPMYGPYFRKNLYLKIAAIGIEKNAIGTPIGTVPKGNKDPKEEAAFKEVLSNFAANESAYLVKPEGWDVTVVEGKFDAAAVKELILLENTEMINTLVANFLALGMNGGGGAFALGSDLSDFFLAGIQSYANIIAGVWNRRTTPNLIKMNFGEQPAYPKLKASGINDKAGKELAEILASLTSNETIRPDDKLEDFLRKQYKLPKPDVTTTREKAPAAPGFQFSEKRIKLAEGWKSQWKEDQAALQELMQKNLAVILENYKKQISSKWKSTSPAARPNIAMQLEPKGLTEYRAELREELARIANTALIGAKKETPKAKNVKLSESIQLAAPRGGFFDALPANIRRIVQSQANLIVQAQSADMNKVVSFQFASSAPSTEDVDQVLTDIDDAVVPTIEGSTSKGMNISAAAGDAVSSIANQARLEWFFEPEVLDTIESFTFVNEDPQSEICQELDGTTWAVNDPDLSRYSPPLHHNCKSRLEPNEKGAEGNPKINRGGTSVSEKGLKSITLCECSYHLDFKLVEPKKVQQ